MKSKSTNCLDQNILLLKKNAKKGDEKVNKMVKNT